MFHHILLVCTANICRSPMAEAWIRAKHPCRSISSAGVAALVGKPADPCAIHVMDSIGIDLSSHRARQLDEALCWKNDLILAMERAHVRAIEKQFPMARGKTYLLGHWSSSYQEISDPYQKPLFAFEASLHQIQDSVSALSDFLPSLAVPT
jgi:protein-tyrosine phosphatase